MEMKKPTQRQLLNLAQTYINNRIPTLESRKSDSLDFYDISVWNLESALLAAYDLGYRAAQEEE